MKFLYEVDAIFYFHFTGPQRIGGFSMMSQQEIKTIQSGLTS